MLLEYKSDFDKCSAFWSDFWNKRNPAPALLHMKKVDQSFPALPDAMSLLEGSVEQYADALERYFDAVEPSGDLMPGVILCFGADHLAAMLGAKMSLDPKNKTSWITPYIDNWDNFRIRFDPDNPVFRRTIECAEYLRKRFDDKLIVSPTHLQGNLDCLSAMRGVQELLYDLIDDPDKIHRALDEVNIAFAQIVEEFRKTFDTASRGSLNRHGIYQPGFSGLLQCDFSCMINPDMFAEFVLPSLAFESETVDYAEYHLDGPGALVHVDAICSVPGIKVIQWQPGAALLNNDWRDLHKKIDDLGCGQYFFQPDAEMCRWIKQNLRQKNLCLDVMRYPEDEFEEIEKIVKE